MTTSELLDASPAETQEWLETGKAVLIDVRETDEYAREHIAAASSVPLSTFDAAKVPGDRDKIAVFHCGTGSRTQQAAGQLVACGFQRACQLTGGLAAWRRAGLPTVVDRRAPLPIQRQVQIVAGTMILTGVVLGWSVNPGWYGLAGFVGAGLITAGVTGWCGMANLLNVMPWNRRARTAHGDAAVAGKLR